MNENSTSKNSKGKSLLLSGISLSILTLFSRILGLLREMTKASFLGTSSYADAFGVAFLIPNLFRRLFAENSISVAFIPTFKKYLEEIKTDEDKKKALQFVSATFTLVAFTTAVVVSIGMIFTPFIVPYFCKDGDDTLLKETAILTRIMFPYLFVISIAAFFQGILNSLKIFAVSGFTPILFNSIVVISTYVLAPHTENPARAMSIGVLLGGCVQALFQLPFVIKTGWATGFTSLKNAFTNKGTKKVLCLIGPTIIGMAAYQLNDAVSTMLASKADTGILSSLQYSLRLQELILGIFAVTIGTIMLPDLSSKAASKDWKAFNNMLEQAIKIIALITIPISFYAFITGKNIIALVYKNRNFTEESVLLTLKAFRFHIIGLFFIAANRIITPAFYAQGEAKKPTIAGLLGFVANIAFAIALVRPLKGGGIALSLTIASFVNTLFLIVFLARMPNMDMKSVVSSSSVYVFKMILFSVIASIPTVFIYPLLINIASGHNRLISEGIPVFACAIVFAVVGIILLIISKDPILKLAMGKIKRS
ncbi:MAG: murein biosynthesis integral membrane protein MurJ [Treponema sp.]|nr:murein biosynthesis integral membrane protein MurJ [Treponema sp.]